MGCKVQTAIAMFHRTHASQLACMYRFGASAGHTCMQGIVLARVSQQPPQGARALEALTTVSSMFVAAAVALCHMFACACHWHIWSCLHTFALLCIKLASVEVGCYWAC